MAKISAAGKNFSKTERRRPKFFIARVTKLPPSLKKQGCKGGDEKKQGWHGWQGWWSGPPMVGVMADVKAGIAARIETDVEAAVKLVWRPVWRML